jgi:hypothetical protein
VPIALIGGVTIVLIGVSLWVFAIRRGRYDAAAEAQEGGDRGSGAAAEAW